MKIRQSEIMWKTNKFLAISRVFLLGILCSLPMDRALAQPCTLCPVNATDTAIGAAFGVFVTRNGVEVRLPSGGAVGACEVLTLKENVQYASVGTSGGVGAGFSGGSGNVFITQRGGTPVRQFLANVTPGDMATTIVGPGAPN